MSAVAAVLAIGCAAHAMEVTIHGGDNGQPTGPICFQADKPFDAKTTYAISTNGTVSRPAQADDKGRLWWWGDTLEPGQSNTCRIQQRPVSRATPAVNVQPGQEDLIHVTIGLQPFTALNFKRNESKPYLYPVIGPTGGPVTRDYPMKDKPDEKKHKRQDHAHHRSIWTGFGDIRTKNFDQPGSNYWDELGAFDRQRVKRIIRTASGPVFGQIEAEIEWVRSEDGRRELTEYRTYTFWCGNRATRIIDVKNVFSFTDSDVMFADTKEGGILSLRVATTIDEKGGGRMTNANGQVGEKGASGCWGKPAAWCDYVGRVNGKTVGIAVFDAEKNFGHPTRWHIRGYGLYAANPFGLCHFARDKTLDGAHIFKKGEAAEFNYRILIHEGDTRIARVADHWDLYRAPAIAIADSF